MNLAASGFYSTDRETLCSLLAPDTATDTSVPHLPGVIMVRSVLFWPHWCHLRVSSELDNIIIIIMASIMGPVTSLTRARLAIMMQLSACVANY